jgi:peptidoglycan hydrolase-like amidase
MYSHWPLEALKAQAVAARSYALARYVQPPSDYYHIGSDEAYQVYKGLETETGSTRAAVQATASQILSYKGGIVDSTYAASDDLVITAHGGRGMSQQGAFKLASKGYDYLHILGTYYPGAGLARLQFGGK